MSLSVETAATTYPVTLAEVKLSGKVDGTDRDDEINVLIAAATSYVEDYTGRALMTQSLMLSLDSFTDAMMLPKGPATEVTSVVYDDEDGTEQTLDDTYYTADLVNDPPWVVRNSDYSWPTTIDAVNAVRITYTAGYATLPPPVKLAVLMLVTQWIDGPSGQSDKPVSEVPHAVTALLANHRSYGF